jgi:DNA-binding response OmpR family regulator
VSTPSTVLTIEDQPDIRRLIRMTLEFKGLRVVEAGDAAQGLATARRERPQLILLDVMMPGESGLSLSRTLAADPQLAGIPVVMLSALGQQQDVEAGLGAGARAYLVKPFDPWQLLELVDRLLADPAAAA